ncbi:MAG TPA: glycoside hydrolase family 20 zincin-like fold domain-containing protein, partial [Mucilaginibacter sp.]|nr:glycoside hydrolase family 20 zincin-like fold domain-containing protein [Mucilaginibacter sp.]
MSRYFLITMLLACTGITAMARPNFNPHDLSVAWQAIKNDSPKRGQSLNAITITNNGKSTLPAGGWKIYFNSARMVEPVTPSGNATIAFLNGDLFSLTPSASFGELKPGQSVRIEFVDDDLVVNITDGPEGFYLVWDDQPEKGYNLGAFIVEPFSPSYPGLVTPAVIYDQNKNITDIPEEQLTRVFPTPVSYKETGGYFSYSSNTKINADPRFESELDNLRHFTEVVKSKSSPNTISLKCQEGLGAEAYELSVTPGNIIINASTPAGAFYAIQSLKTLIPPSAHSQKEIQIPCVEIKDE